ncbi:OmpA family protein [Ascidiaceihabitans sp.]|uniref:OmpA family protein n=1 Tax=Ascidiaceihabitans sp. TaxID=1872644 RepID=UPI003297AB8A
MICRALIFSVLAGIPATAGAITLEMPGPAELVANELDRDDSYFLPTSPFTDGALDGVVAEGAVRQTAWKIEDGTMTTLQLLSPLRQALQDEGFVTLYECEALTCGGFDFRYQIELLPEPDMHVNLGDFRYFSAKRGELGAEEYASLVVSRSAQTGFVQLTQIGLSDRSVPFTASTKAPPPQTAPALAGPIGTLLESVGHATLDDLRFKTGSSELGDDRFTSLEGLASYLAARPDRQIKLVGHTDASGSLDVNISLSKRRAAAVAARLVDTHGVSADQVSADGVGFLSPRASNLTEEGRNLNRRVEVILTSTQ